jgi:transcriptional regulator with XRE-family HTH domain
MFVAHYKELTNIGILLTMDCMEVNDLDILIGRNLRRLRESKGMSQEQLGIKIGNRASKISAVENGKEGLGKALMLKICSVLKVQPIEFYLTNETPLIKDDNEMKLIERARTYPELEEQLLTISAALFQSYEGRKIDKHNPIQKTKKAHRKPA